MNARRLTAAAVTLGILIAAVQGRVLAFPVDGD
jgi:hypothetical protein